MIKKLVSILMAMSILGGSSVQAASALLDEDKVFTKEDDSEICEHMQLNPVYVEPEDEIAEEDEIQETKQTNEESTDLVKSVNPLRSTTDPNAIWDALFSIEFGDAYNKPYQHNSSSTNVSGVSNRLVIEETDLHLPGKNGLDLDIRRKYDNQDCNAMYLYSTNTSVVYTHYVIYPYVNQSTNETINIAFMTVDDMYTYMYDEFCVSTLNRVKSYSYRKSDGSTITYYIASDIYRKRANTGITLKRDASAAGIGITVKDDTNRPLSEYILSARSKNSLSGGWTMEVPGVVLHVTEGYWNSAKTILHRQYMCSFQDKDGIINSFNGNDTVYVRDPSSNNSHLSRIKGRNISYSLVYDENARFNGRRYNFKAVDPKGYTYYFYSDAFETALENHSIGKQFFMSIIAVEDNYGHAIEYQYEDDTATGSVTKMIDTYGREINITRSNGVCEVSYEDESGDVKRITYTGQELPANELDNNSVLKNKDLHLFTVTDQLGEETKYYSRTGEVINQYGNAATNLCEGPGDGIDAYITHQNNIERIEYPTGAVAEYEYRCFSLADYVSKTVNKVYMVTASRDIVNNNVENDIEYSFTKNVYNITKTSINNSSGEKQVSEYNEKKQLTSSKSTPISASYPYYQQTFMYDDNGYPKKITTNDNGSSKEVFRTNDMAGRIGEEKTGNRKTEYWYYENGSIRRSVTSIKSGKSYLERFRYETTPNALGDKPEYARVLQGNELVYQVKSQTKYEYNADGEIADVKQWTNDTNADGELDENDDIIVSQHTYQTTSDKDLIYTDCMNDVLNADGDNDGTVSNTYKLNMFGSIVSKTDPYGTVSQIEYDDLNRPVKYIYANGTETNVEYNMDDLYTLVTTPDGIRKKNIYDDFGRLIEVQRIYDNTSQTLEEYTYDTAGRVETKISRTDEGVGTKEQYTYNVLSKPIEKKVYSLPDTLLYTENYTYSGNDVNMTTTAADGTVKAQIADVYDVYDRLTCHKETSGNTVILNNYTYDYLDRVETSTDAKGNVTSYEYDCNNNITKVTDAAGNETSSEYDLAGRVYSVTDANGNTSYAEYDKLGRTVKEITPFDDDNETEAKTYYDKNSNIVKKAVKHSAQDYREEEYRYDVMGNLLGVIGNDGATDIVTQYEYDDANRMIKRRTGLSSYSTAPTGGSVTTYEYGDDGFLLCETDPVGTETLYSEYDYVGNVKYSCKNDIERSYIYGPFGLKKAMFEGEDDTIKEYTYNSLGAITEIKNSDTTNGADTETTENYTYDAFGRVATHTTNDGSVQSYVYDNNSNITGYMLNKNGVVKNRINYAYNNLNQLTSLEKDGIITLYGYNDIGKLISKENNRGISSEYVYNAAGLVTSLTNSVNNTAVNCREYVYYLDGTKFSEEEVGNGGSYHAVYSYDNAGRLISESTTTSSGYSCELYTYDLRGNRITKEDTENDIFTSYTYDAADKLTLSETETEGEATEERLYTYDLNGNLTEELVDNYEATALSKTYGYDNFDRLTSFNDGTTLTTYEYNADNLRTAKISDGVRTDYVWDGANLMYEYGGTTGSYAYDMSGVVQKDTDTYLKDEHGNVIGKYSIDGVSQGTSSYDAFGNVTSGTIDDPFGYCGEYRDSESGLIYLRNRYYDTNTGRFITEDPAKDGVNWYSYCAGDPVNAWDPWGLKMTCSVSDSLVVLEMLGELTDDELEFVEYVDVDGVGTGVGEIKIAKTYDTNRHIGQTLISNLVYSNTEVNINAGFDSQGDTNYTTEIDASNKIIIYIDNNNTRQFGDLVENKNGGDAYWEEFEDYIYLGHELVHAWREIKGLYIPSINADGYYEYGNVREEELQTCGINYNDSAGNPVKQYTSYISIISENGLRLENPNITSIRVMYTP